MTTSTAVLLRAVKHKPLLAILSAISFFTHSVAVWAFVLCAHLGIGYLVAGGLCLFVGSTYWRLVVVSYMARVLQHDSSYRAYWAGVFRVYALPLTLTLLLPLVFEHGTLAGVTAGVALTGLFGLAPALFETWVLIFVVLFRESK